VNLHDCYRILGVPVTATDEEIRTAYRKLAFVYHPDKNPGNPAAEQRFREIAGAYKMLRDHHESPAPDDGLSVFFDLVACFYESFFGQRGS
jgi:DnaJ-class molecular chaperone